MSGYQMGTPRASITFAIPRELCDHKAETPSLPFHVEATVTAGQDENLQQLKSP